tara:strand:+ start:41593 stop:42939 length:1347 start_codon:yes stop_codon:yes gene_type:complete
MKRPHPDIVVGQPIPQIEPRINEARLRLTRSLSVWWAACIVMILIMSVIRTVFSLGVEYIMFFMGATLVLWFAPLLRPTKIIEAGYRKTRNGASDPDHWDIPIMDHAIHLVMTWGMMIAFSTLIMIGGFALAFALIGIYMVAGGMAVIFLARMARQPAQISCEECSYPLVGLTLPCMCPECGRSLLEATDTTDFPRVRSPWFVRIGGAMIVVGLLIAYTGFSNPGRFYKVFPQNVLGSMAVKDRDAFEQLTGSPMTPEQTQALIESLLEESRRGELGYPQSRWLGDVYEAGGLSESQIEAVMERVPPISIRVPNGPVRVGQKIEISLISAEADLPSHAFTVYYYFAGFQIDDDPEAHQGDAHHRLVNFLYYDFGDMLPPNREGMTPPIYSFIPISAREIRVRARVLVVLTDPKNLLTFTWDSSMNGVFETQPSWMRVLDLEALIVVED